VGAWDRVTGNLLWRIDNGLAIAINASPMIADHTAFVANGSTVVFAADVLTGSVRWQVKLDGDGFDWGNATVGAPAYANGIVIVPTLYADLVALDAATGAELWRHRGKPSANPDDALSRQGDGRLRSPARRDR